MDRRLHLASIGRVPAARRRIVRAMHLSHFAFVVLHHALRSDEVSITQANFFSRRQAEIFWWRHFAEIILLDVELAREGYLAHTRALVFWIVGRVHLFDKIFRVVVDHDLQRTQHSHHTRRALVEVLADEVLKHRKFNNAVGARHACGCHKIANRFWRVSTAAQATQRGHARIVPAAYRAFFHHSP